MRSKWRNCNKSLSVIWIGLLLLITVGCDVNGLNVSGADDAMTTGLETTVQDRIPGLENVENEDLARALSLLDPEVTGIPLTKTRLITSWGHLGALEGVGFLSPDPDVVFSVYVFEDLSEHHSVYIVPDKLRAAIGLQYLPAERIRNKVVSVKVAPILFFGHVADLHKDGDTSDAEAKLRLLAEAIAGGETFLTR